MNPGLASEKPKTVETAVKPKGLKQKDLSFKDQADILRTGNYQRDLVDVTSHNDFPTLGASPVIQES